MRASWLARCAAPSRAPGASALWLLLAALSCQCSSKPLSEGDLFGEYSTVRTLLVTGAGAPTEEGCGVPQAPITGEAALRYEVSGQDGNVEVTELVGGCVLAARIEGDVVIADNSACSLREGAPLRQLGVTSRVYSVFRLDARQKTVVWRAVTLAAVTTGESRSCSVSEERIVDARNRQADEPGTRVRYTGSLTTTIERPATEANCGRKNASFESSGYLSLDRAGLSARLDGFGCRVSLAEPSGGSLFANAQPCVPDGAVDFKGLGLDRLDVESLSVDLNDATTLWRARAWRELPSGRASYCLSFSGSIE